MWFHFEIGVFALERAFPRLFQPFLQAVHAKASLARVALQGVHQDPVADAAF